MPSEIQFEPINDQENQNLYNSLYQTSSEIQWVLPEWKVAIFIFIVAVLCLRFFYISRKLGRHNERKKE